MEKIILASKSPRRIDIFSKYELDFLVVPAKIEEKNDFASDDRIIAMALALEKALDVAKDYNDKFVIGADTVVSIDNRLLGKPSSKAEAKEFIELLSGRWHKVITGIAIVNLDKGIKELDYEETSVLFNEISNEQIEKYILTEEPYDKAGAYGIQSDEFDFVKEIRGDYNNVVGLPFDKLKMFLVKYCEQSI